MTRISIIVPSKDSGEFLLRTVRSVLDSDIHAEGLECIVVASDSDHSINLLPIEDPRLIIHRTTASGLSRLINAGVEQSSGEIIGILKSGDLYEPGALRNVLLQFEAQSQCDALYGQVNLIDTNDRFIRRLKIFTPTVRRLSARPCLHSSAFFFRRRLIERIGAFDESVSHWPHYDFWIRIALAKVPFASTQTILACNRVHPVSQKSKTDREMQAAREALNLIRSRLGISSIRWAIHYGRSVAEKAGHSRTKSSTFDVVTLQSAIAELKLDAETNIERYLRLWSVVGQHGLSEINKFRRNPKYLLRFLPWSSGARIRKALGRRIFQLRYDDPHPCELPTAYFSTISLHNPPTIAIVTPNLNQGKYIERTLRSVLDQNYPKLEYVVQDGCSSDNSLDVIRRYEGRLTSWESVRDKGQSQAINFGLSRTRGEIMAYLNSDDVLVPGSLAYVAKYFQEHPKVDVVYGNRLLIDEQDQVINRWILPDHDHETLRWADYIPQETMFWRRRAWEAVGGAVDESFQFAMDWDLILRFQAKGMIFRRLPRFLGAFRITDSQKTSQLINTFGLNEMTRLRKRELGFCPTEREVSRQVKRYIHRQRSTEKFFLVSESISKLISPYREWKIDEGTSCASMPYDVTASLNRSAA